MAGIVYKVTCGSYTRFLENSRSRPDRNIAVVAKNARARKTLDERGTRGAQDVVIRHPVLGTSRFNLSVALRSVQAEDPSLPDPRFWYIAEGSAMARRIEVAPGCSMDAHITWDRPQNIGRKKQDAPMLSGTVHATLTPPMGKARTVGLKLRFDPISNRISFG